MEETISLHELFHTLRKRLWLIVLVTVVAVVAAAVVSFALLTPIYESSTQLLVNQKVKDQNLLSNQIQSDVQLINTYTDVIKSDVILTKVADKLGHGTTASDIRDAITVSTNQNSQVMTLTAQDPNPYQAKKIANTVASVFADQMPSIMNIDNVKILKTEPVSKHQAPVKPKPFLNIAIALVVGLLVGAGLAFLLEYLDNSIKTESDIEKILELPVLGAVSTISDAELQSSKRNRSVTRTRGESLNG